MDELERRVEALERDGQTRHDALTTGLSSLVRLIGEPGNGPGQPPSGLYFLMQGLDKRLQPFERFKERAMGAVTVGIPLIVALWWLGGDKIASLFHG